MNPDNPTFRTDAEARRAEEFVKMKTERDRYRQALEVIASNGQDRGMGWTPAQHARIALDDVTDEPAKDHRSGEDVMEAAREKIRMDIARGRDVTSTVTEDPVLAAEALADRYLLEINCLRSVLSEWEFDKSCFVQWGRAEEMRYRREIPDDTKEIK